MQDIYAPTWLEASKIRDAVCRQDPDALDRTLRGMLVHMPGPILDIIRYLPFPTGLDQGSVAIQGVRFEWNHVTNRLERV